MDTELKLLLFSPCQGKLNIAIQDIQNMLGLITIVVFYGSPPCKYTCLQNVFLFTVRKHFAFGVSNLCCLADLKEEEPTFPGDTGLISSPKAEET